jgi:hypothetical protein
MVYNRTSQTGCHGTPVFREGCQGLRETKMRNGERVLLAVLSFYVRIKIRVATAEADHSVTDSTQSIHRCFKPEAP